MTIWNELFKDDENIARAPESEIYRFVKYLERVFTIRPLLLWDLCCGAGRHSAVMADLGHSVYVSDSAPRAIDLTLQLLSEAGLTAETAVSDMTVCPWPNLLFHGVVSWDSLYHNTLGNIQKTVNEIHTHLVPKGLFMVNLKSTKADTYGEGKEIEKNTFVPLEGAEAGMPHHFFDEEGIRRLFEKWEIKILVERIMTYRQRCDNFFEANPFHYTTWCVLAQNRATHPL
jgi:SAM-dependent methyltransferase